MPTQFELFPLSNVEVADEQEEIEQLEPTPEHAEGTIKSLPDAELENLMVDLIKFLQSENPQLAEIAGEVLVRFQQAKMELKRNEISNHALAEGFGSFIRHSNRRITRAIEGEDS